ncbi:hypothetical protein ElyMa_004868000 [Elysia marginata]|uniref:Uncharacterized protein n=1 Tax=Elysia marginata TaxID=1093978 RepID=A0AAV4ISW4_9GAST|nr:hypothetical protein ElyMa_004868000 [Elysia marginata]
MEEGPTVDLKPTFTRLFEDEKPDVQALQIKEEPLASANKHGPCCLSKDIDCKLDEKRIVPYEHANTSSNLAVVQLFEGGNSREQNLLPGDGSLSVKRPNCFEALLPQVGLVKNEFCVAADDGDLIKTEQSKIDLEVNIKEEACIARLQAHVETYSSTFITENNQETETTEDVEVNETNPQYLISLNDFQDSHQRPQEQSLERDRELTRSAESENLQKTLSNSSQRQLRCDQSGRKRLSSDLSTEKKDTNSHVDNVNIGDSYATDLEIRTERVGVVKTLRTIDSLAGSSSGSTKTMVSVDLEKPQQDSDGKGRSDL